MNCGSYKELDLYRDTTTGLYITVGARNDTARDAPAYIRTNVPAYSLLVRGLGADFNAPLFNGFAYLPRFNPSDFRPYIFAQCVIMTPDYSTAGRVLFGVSCADLTPVDRNADYPWPWVWEYFSDDFLGRFGTPPKNVPILEISRPTYVLGWWGGWYWQALPMLDAADETKGGGGYLVTTAATLGGYMLPAQIKKTLISPPVPPTSLPYLRTAVQSSGFWLREGTKDYALSVPESASIESVGGNYYLKVSLIWHI